MALGLATSDLTAETSAVLEDHGLGPTQYGLLRILRKAGARGATHGELTRRMIVGVPDVTRMVDRMKSSGWVERERDPEDRRRVLHRITPAGRALLERVEPRLTEVHDWIESAVGEEERALLVDLCGWVIEIVRARRSGTDQG